MTVVFRIQIDDTELDAVGTQKSWRRALAPRNVSGAARRYQSSPTSGVRRQHLHNVPVTARGQMNEDRLDSVEDPGSRADWSRQLIRPIYLSDGRILRTLKDAAECILKRPPSPSAKVAAARIIEVAHNRGDMVSAHAAIRLALLSGPKPKN